MIWYEIEEREKKYDYESNQIKIYYLWKKHNRSVVSFSERHSVKTSFKQFPLTPG